MHNPKDDIPAYNAMRRRQFEEAFGPADRPGFWDSAVGWAVALVTFPAFLVYCYFRDKTR